MSDKPRLGYRFEDLHEGMTFRSPGRTITEADLTSFAGLTGDHSELHTSDVYARSSQFGQKVAHGLLGLTYAHGLMWARTGELRETAIAFGGGRLAFECTVDRRRRSHPQHSNYC